MTNKELYVLTMKLFDCSESMKEINMECSSILLAMASKTLEVLEESCTPEEIKEEIIEIKSMILDNSDD